MPTRTITFTSDVDNYKAGESVELPRNIAKRYIRDGVAKTTVRKKVTKKKVTKKKETASVTPQNLERATTDDEL